MAGSQWGGTEVMRPVVVVMVAMVVTHWAVSGRCSIVQLVDWSERLAAIKASFARLATL